MTRLAEVPTVVVIAYHSRDDLPECLRALRATDGGPPPLLVVENGCPERSADGVERLYPGASVLRLTSNLGFAGGANVALDRLLSAGREALLLNADTRPEAGWLLALRKAAADRPDAGVLGSVLLTLEGDRLDPMQEALLRGQSCGVDAVTRSEPFDVSMVIGAAFWVRRSALMRAGGFDPLFFAYGEETDLCRRLQHLGFSVLLVPGSRVRHRGEGSSRSALRSLRVRWLRARNDGLLLLKRPLLPLRTSVLDLPFRVAVRAGTDLSRGRPLDAVLRLLSFPYLLARLPEVERSRRAERRGPAHLTRAGASG
ncbi:MAG: glycosyltransferase family 2 protein [Planctomycetota bacterium]|jgi:GT2 family glycosyltransferase